ncbi:MAG: hypothetical protein IJ421_00005 [Prevotella sp.]|nr:hypothetical protein [Prevotella sp.]
MAKNTTTTTFVLEDSIATASRAIPGSTELNATSNTMAQSLLKEVIAKPELHEQANKVIDFGDFGDTIELIKQVYTPEELKLEALKDCSDAELSRLRESRRSDRSKAKKQGLKQTASCLRYFAASIAELMILDAMGKEYAGHPGSSTELDVEALAGNQDALNRKIRSLQSKVSVLKRQGQFAPADWEGFKTIEETQKQIAELQAHRISAKTTSSSTAKVPTMSAIKAGVENMSAEERQALLEMIAQMQGA